MTNYTPQQTNTILAALRYYQKQGLGDPRMRPQDIHRIATDHDETSLDEKGIDELCEAINLDEDAGENEGYFPITRLCRDDLKGIGFDTKDVDDATMERIAGGMGNAYLENGYWIDLPIIAEHENVPRLKGKKP